MAEKMMLIPEGAFENIRKIAEEVPTGRAQILLSLSEAIPHDCPAADERLREAVQCAIRKLTLYHDANTAAGQVAKSLSAALEPPKPAFDVERAREVVAQLASGGAWQLHEVTGLLEAAIREREGR